MNSTLDMLSGVVSKHSRGSRYLTNAIDGLPKRYVQEVETHRDHPSNIFILPQSRLMVVTPRSSLADYFYHAQDHHAHVQRFLDSKMSNVARQFQAPLEAHEVSILKRVPNLRTLLWQSANSFKQEGLGLIKLIRPHATLSKDAHLVDILDTLHTVLKHSFSKDNFDRYIARCIFASSSDHHIQTTESRMANRKPSYQAFLSLLGPTPTRSYFESSRDLLDRLLEIQPAEQRDYKDSKLLFQAITQSHTEAQQTSELSDVTDSEHSLGNEIFPSEVTVYVANRCERCTKAREFLEDQGIDDYNVIDITNNDLRRKEMIEKSKGHFTVPQVFIAGQHIGGLQQLRSHFNSGKAEHVFKFTF